MQLTETTWQNVISGLLIVLSIVIVLFLLPATVYQPQGIISPVKKITGTKPVAEIVAYKTAPAGASTVGYFSVEFFEKDNPVSAQERMVEYAKELAGQIGANGVVVEQIAAGGNTWYMNGKAIDVAG